ESLAGIDVGQGINTIVPENTKTKSIELAPDANHQYGLYFTSNPSNAEIYQAASDLDISAADGQDINIFNQGSGDLVLATDLDSYLYLDSAKSVYIRNKAGVIDTNSSIDSAGTIYANKFSDGTTQISAGLVTGAKSVTTNTLITTLVQNSGNIDIQTTSQNGSITFATNGSGNIVFSTDPDSFITTSMDAHFEVRPNGTGDIKLIGDADSDIFIGDGGGANYAKFDQNGLLTFAGLARPIRTISLAPEYPAAIKKAYPNGQGRLTADYEITQLDNHAYYNWTSSDPNYQEYEVSVRVHLPKNFAGWNLTNPFKINAWTDDFLNTFLDATVYDSKGELDPSVTFANLIPDTDLTWQSINLTPSGIYTPDSWITLVLHYSASNAANVRTGEITLDYLSSN
ncbi:MAG: hypothetical protein UT11_C0065G0001, partial [Berkelbacteria bacterium GW2011_GWA2_38_9]